MIAETYICSMADGSVEYGYTFKENSESENSKFDVVLGRSRPIDSKDMETIDEALQAFQTDADKIAEVLTV